MPRKQSCLTVDREETVKVWKGYPAAAYLSQRLIQGQAPALVRSKVGKARKRWVAGFKERRRLHNTKGQGSLGCQSRSCSKLARELAKRMEEVATPDNRLQCR